MHRWNVSLDGGRTLGTVRAWDREATLTAASARWPSLASQLTISARDDGWIWPTAPPRRIEADLPAAAHHEAGHAVIATHLGLRVRRIAIGSLVGRDSGQLAEYHGATGSLTFRRPPRIQALLEPRRRERAENFAVVLMAESRHHGRLTDWRVSTIDETPLIRELAEAHARGRGTEAATHYHRYLEAGTTSWICAGWPQIVAVARALLRRGELAGAAIEELIRTSAGPEVTPAVPPRRSGRRR